MARTVFRKIQDFEGDVARHVRRWLRHDEAPTEMITGVAKDARKFWYRLRKSAPDHARKEAIHHVKKGMEAYNLQCYDRAETHFRRALYNDADYARAHTYLANTLYKEGRLTDAVVHWNRAIECEPHSDAADMARERLSQLGSGEGGIRANLEEQMKRR